MITGAWLRTLRAPSELVAAEVRLRVLSSNDNKVAVKGHCVLVPVPGTNYAEGDVQIEGRVLNSRERLQAKIAEAQAQATVRVVDKKDPTGAPITFEVRDLDYGNFRALWADTEGKPNLLVIAARHESIRRYLGDAPDYPRQSGPVFRALLAEIVAESVCRKSLAREAQERPFDFSWADMQRPHETVDDVFAQFQKRLRMFLPDAHRVMLSDRELADAFSAPTNVPPVAQVPPLPTKGERKVRGTKRPKRGH